MYFGCTGIVVESNEAGASILTSASLVRSDDDDRNMKSILMVCIGFLYFIACLLNEDRR